MSDATPSELEEQLAKEVATLRDLAVKSTDSLIVAKAIAASDKGVQQLILDRLNAGERLVEVLALEAVAPSELQVFFRFVPAKDKEITPFVDTGVLVFVDLFKGDVIGTVDPFILQPERRVGRPFVAVAALKTSEFAGSEQAMELLLDRERAFFNSLGLARLAGGVGGGPGGIHPLCNTAVTSVTYTPTGPGGRYAAEDWTTEAQNDCIYV